MSTQRIYALPVEITDWKFDGATEIQFNWEYDAGSDALLELYDKGKKQQWDASTRLDWSLELNPDNPMELKDEAISIYGTDYWRKMTDKERSWLRRNLQANSISQFMHGEQGALIATAKIVATRARHERQVLCRHPGDGRGAPCRGLQAPAAREVRARLSDQQGAEDAARADADRPPLGHDLSRHAGADRGPGAGRLPVDPRQVGQHAGRRGQRLCHAGRGAARLVRPPGAARLLSAALRRPSATSARSSWSRRSISCATASTSRRSGSGSACRPRCWTRSTTIPSR